MVLTFDTSTVAFEDLGQLHPTILSRHLLVSSTPT